MTSYSAKSAKLSGLQLQNFDFEPVKTEAVHPDLMKVFNYYLKRESMQWACRRNRTFLRMVGDRFVPYAEVDKMSGLIDMEYKKNSNKTAVAF
ncbi:unnamed protein product, partial [Mesorhabditis spiculigera]